MSKTDDPILTISIASRLLRVHPRTLMLYERYGFVTPFRTSTQRRLFSKKHLQDLQFVKYLTQTKKLNIPGVRLVLEALEACTKKGLDLKRLLFPDFKVKKLI